MLMRDSIEDNKTSDFKAIGISKRRRKKLWELNKHCHCSIIGTCLTIKELKKIAHKTEIDIKNEEDYKTHGMFVKLASEKNEASKMMHKNMDRKYQRFIRKFFRAKTVEDVEILWNESVELGEFQGGYWAVMTHPVCNQGLAEKVFGRLHMLTHLAIQKHSENIYQKKEQEDRINALQQRLDRQRMKNKEEMRSQKEKIQILGKALTEKNHQVEKLQESVQKMNISPELVEKTIARNEQLKKELEQIRIQRNEAEKEINQMKNKQESLKQKQDKLRQILKEERDYIQLLEDEIEKFQKSVGPPDCPDRGTEKCPGPSLCGRRILYVGGIKRLVTHYKQIVEQTGGKFMHHDGGLENPNSKLSSLTDKADTVICPVDCVSHGAVQKMKENWKLDCKNFLFLRTSSISCLARAIKNLQESEDES